MGVRLVINNKYGSSGSIGTDDHNELLNRDLADQHPIHAITGLQDTIDDIYTYLNKIILAYKDTNSIDLTFEPNTQTLSADIKIVDSTDNAIEVYASGLFVDKYPDIWTEDTETIHLYMSGKGMTLKEMYKEGQVFSHGGSWNNISNTSEANAWYFDDSLDSFVQPKNTNTFTGFVSNNKYKYRTYNHQVRLRSTNSDDDVNGLIIGYVIDELGHPHTLSAWVSKGMNGDTPSFQIWYDYCLPDAQCLYSKSNYPLRYSSYKGWNQASNGIMMKVNKHGNTFDVTVGDWNSNSLNPSSTVEINLLDYTWGDLFSGAVQYGYCNYSQANSFFTDIIFAGKGPLKADVKVSPDEDNALEIRPNGLYCGGGPGGVGGTSNALKITQISHGFKIGDVLYCKSDGKYAKGLAHDSNLIDVVGIVTAIKSDDVFILTTAGQFNSNLYDSYDNGSVIYLSESSYGETTNSPYTFFKPIGIKIPEGILINIQRANEIYDTLDISSSPYTSNEITAAIEFIWS